MASNRSPDMCYNGSGYVDKTARDAIYRADRDLLKVRRLQLMNRLHSVAKEHGFNAHRQEGRTPKAAFGAAKSAEYCGKVNLVEIGDDEVV